MKRWILGNLGTKIMAFFLAVIMWMYLYSEAKGEKTFSAPFHPVLSAKKQEDLFVEFRAGSVRLPSGTGTVTVKVAGPRGEVEATRLREIRCTPAFDEAAFSGESGTFLHVLRREDFNLPEQFRVEPDPPEIEVRYEKFVEREVELLASRADATGAPGRGFEVKEVRCIPGRIRVRVPAGSGRDLVRVGIRRVNVEGLTEGFLIPGRIDTDSLPYEVRTVRGQDFFVQVTLAYERARKSFSAVPLRLEGDSAVLAQIQLDTATAVVHVEGPGHLLENLTEEDFRIFVPVPIKHHELKPGDRIPTRDFRCYFVRDPALASALTVTIMADRDPQNREVTLLVREKNP